MIERKLFLILACLTASTVPALCQNTVNILLTGSQQVPAILSPGRGTFTATLTGTSPTFTLTYSNLSSTVTMAHIHFGQRGVNGAVVVWFCGGGGKPACPAANGTVTGTVTAADVLAVPTQGVRAGNFGDLERIVLSGNAYVNVHTTNFPDGEVRGQIVLDQ
jgi:CHRD domain